MLEQDFELCDLNKYYHLDLNIDQIKADLSELGIHVKANYFNLEKEQNRITEQAAKKQ